MITATTSPLHQLLAEACDSVARTLAPGELLEPVDLGPAGDAHEHLPSHHAVLAALGGAVSGEVAVFVDDAMAEALLASGLQDPDLAAALASTFDDLSSALGAAVVGVPQAMDGRLAVNRLATFEHNGLTALNAGSLLRAAVGIGLAAPGREPVATVASAPAPAAFERLDLLRGVEMAATVELGRTRMTINDLLSLRDGAIIELDRAAGEAADLYVNGRLMARGEVVVADENYALRITQIVAGEGL